MEPWMEVLFGWLVVFLVAGYYLREYLKTRRQKAAAAAGPRTPANATPMPLPIEATQEPEDLEPEDLEPEDLESARENALLQVRKDIEAHGWHVVAVVSKDEPTYLFTIGLWQSYRHPELVLFPAGEAQGMLPNLQRLCRAVRDGRVLDPDAMDPGAFGSFPGIFCRVDTFWYSRFLGAALGHYGHAEFPVLQVFWPDSEGLFPWFDGFAESFFYHQPLLFESNPEAARLDLFASARDGGDASFYDQPTEALLIDLPPGPAMRLLDAWRWEAEEDNVPFKATIFGDLLTRSAAGEVWFLDTARAEYFPLCTSEEQWREQLSEPAYLRTPPIEDPNVLEEFWQRREQLQPGQVFSWKAHPLAGGEMTCDNSQVLGLEEHLTRTGTLARKEVLGE